MAKEVKPKIESADAGTKKLRLLDLAFLSRDIKKSWVEFKTITRKISGFQSTNSSMN